VQTEHEFSDFLIIIEELIHVAISSQSRSTVPSSRELMQLGISQSQHSF